jgi:Cu-processing system ATP-binding protein
MISYRAFTKDFDGHRAVDALTLDVPPGAVVALLGPNGSGKTTSIKAAAGLVRPTSGEVLLGEAGRPAADPVAREICSFLPQRVSFPEALTGREVVEFYRRLRGAPPDATDRALTFASLNGSSRRAVGGYSGGMLQRLGLAVAMVPDARILLLDEPTAALDPEGLSALYELVDQKRRGGATVFFSSHQLGDVERLADFIAVLVRGRLVAMMGARELAERLADRGVMRVRLRTRVADVLTQLESISPLAHWRDEELVVPGPIAARPAAIETIRTAGGEITGLATEEGRLDELYRALVESRS